MEKKQKDKLLGQHDKAEGNKTASQYKKAHSRSTRPGKADNDDRAAEKALESAESSELEHDELVGERHR